MTPSSSGPAPSLVAAVAILAAVRGGCSEPVPVLQVGELEFHEDQVSTLSEDQLMRLGRMAAVGLAVRDGQVVELGHPILMLREEAALQERLREELMLQWAGVVSKEPGAAERGGLLEPGRRGTWVTEFWEAAGALDEGEVSPVVETGYGFHVLKLEDRSDVPFHEARDRIASEVAGMVSGRARWEEWVAEQSEGIVLDLDSLEEGLPAPGDSAVVARWDDARLLAGEADQRGIQVPPPVRATLEREWERTVRGWASTFEAEDGLSLNQVGRRALAALTRTGQNLDIARREVERHGPALQSAYPIVIGTA